MQGNRTLQGEIKMYMNFLRVLLVLAGDCGYIPRYYVHGKAEGMSNHYIRNIIPLSKIMDVIIRECNKQFDVDISKKEIRCLLWQKNKISYKTIIILMTIYNMLHNVKDKDLAMEFLSWYVNKYGDGHKTMYPYCIKDEIIRTIYDRTDYIEDMENNGEKHETMYVIYRALCDGQFKKKLGDIPWEALVKIGFSVPPFNGSDIPNSHKDNFKSNKLKYIDIRE